MNIKIKQEPEDRDYMDSDSMSCGSDPQRPDPSSSRDSESLESAMAPRYHRARYFRRNYASPECAVCEVCQAEFGGPDLLRLHKLAHFNTASVCYVCDSLICDTNGQPLGSKLILHMAAHHKAICTPSGNYKPEAERAFVCPICLQRFSSNKILTLHTLKQHNQSELTNFTCKICSMDFISGRALHTHLLGNRHKDMKIKVQSIFMCIDCRAIFPARDSYAMHMMMRAQSESCTPLEECVKVMLKEKSLVDNISPMIIKDRIEKTHEEKPSPNLHLNGDTGKTNDSLVSPKESVKYAKGEFICETCNLRFYHPDTLQMHRKMMHNSEKPSNQKDDIENEKFSLLEAIQARSLIAQSAGMSWSCIACGFDFESCDSLAMHVMDQHAGDVTLPISSANTDTKSSSFGASPALTQMSYKPSTMKVFGESLSNTVSSQDLVQNALARIAPLVSLSTQSLLYQRQNIRSPNAYENGTQIKLKRNSSDSLKSNEMTEKRPRPYYTCSECKADFDSKSELDQHNQTCGSFYSKCSFCHVSFHDKDILLQHLKHCNPHPLCTCRSCGQEFRSMISIGEHFSKCPKTGSRNDIICAKCKCALENEDDMISHFEQDICCLASQDSEVTSSKQENNNAKHDRQVYTCKQCAWTSNHANDYIKHMVQNHPVSQNDATTKSNSSPPPDQIERTEETIKKAGQDEIISSLVQDAVASKRNKRKLKPGMRIISSSTNSDWQSMDSETTEVQSNGPAQKPNQDIHGLIAIPVSPGVLSDHSANTESSNLDKQLDATGHEHMQGQELLSFVLSNAQSLIMCKYCNIIYTDRTMYYLHMGLHNLNNPWQCNLCGKVCANVHEFSSHVIHFR